MHLGIDATNISSGGGVTHLLNLLNEADPLACGVNEVTIWTCRSTAKTLPERYWLNKQCPDWAESGIFRRALAQRFELPRLVKRMGCDVLFSPGGTLPARLRIPTVTMSQNMLPFEASEAALFGRFSLMRFKMHLIRQTKSLAGSVCPIKL